MKPEIHPTYHQQTKVTCACGTSWTTGSTLDEINVEICSACHPFFTGKSKLIDTGGRVDRFRSRMAKSKTMSETRQKVASAKRQREAQRAAAEKAAAAKKPEDVLSQEDK